MRNHVSARFLSTKLRALIRLFGVSVLTILLLAPSVSTAQEEEDEERPAAARSAPPDSYRLNLRDQILLSVYDEPDLTAEQRIDGRGLIRAPLLGNVQLAGLTIRQAEEYLQREYVEQRILRHPMVTIQVVEYATREVSVLGAVASPGKLAFPIEAASLDIVDVISEMGGFTGIAKSDSVRVTRTTPDGQTAEFTVNVERMITGKGRARQDGRVQILPGDVIWVPERLF